MRVTTLASGMLVASMAACTTLGGLSSGGIDDAGTGDAAVAAVEPPPQEAGDAGTDTSVVDAASGPRLFWSEGKTIRTQRIGALPQTIHAGVVPTGVAVDPAGGKIYWADNGTDQISRANLDGTNVEVVFTSNNAFANPDGLAIDAPQNRLFWVQSGQVMTANLDGTVPQILYAAQFATAVAVSPAEGVIYFTDNGADTVTRGPYSGGASSKVYGATDMSANPSSIAVDPGGRVFWGEAKRLATLIDGGAPTTVVEATFVTGIALDATSRHVYFTENGADTITRVDYDGMGRTVVYKSNDTFSNPRGLALLP